MRKTAIMTFLMLVLFGMGGCGKDDENAAIGLQWEAVDSERLLEDAGEKGTEPAGGERNSTDGAGDLDSGRGNVEGYADLVEGLIENQSFEVELDGWGKVFFVAAAPSNEGETPHFMLLKDEEVVYAFPETPKSTGDKFIEVGAVAFQDYNKDGKEDIIVLVTYSDGENKWNEPEIFLQENSDNMFYLDHPELDSYRVEGAAQAGAAFYRDTFLEEYLSSQRLTDSVAALRESWGDYVDYVDSLSGIFSVERQIKLFAQSRAVWSEGMDYANDIYQFTLASLSYDGKLTLIVSNQGGTGAYTYSKFYQIDEKGNLKELETSFEEGKSQPDIIEEQMTVYSSFSNDGMKNHFIVYDMLKVSPDQYVNRVSSLSLQDGFVLETPLADQTIVYEGEDLTANVSSQDCNGNGLTEEEYDNFADTYYSKMGLTKKTAAFEWIDVFSLTSISDEEAEAVLKQAYDGFSLN